MLNNMKTVDIAVLVAQLSIILAHINLGTKEQKAKAKAEYRKLIPMLEENVGEEAFKLAVNQLGLSEGELKLIEQTSV